MNEKRVPRQRESEMTETICCVCGKKFLRTPYSVLCDFIIDGQTTQATCSQKCYVELLGKKAV